MQNTPLQPLANTVAERAMIGAALVTEEVPDFTITADHFAEPRAKACWEAIIAVHDAGKPVTDSNLEAALIEAGKAAAVGYSFFADCAVNFRLGDRISPLVETLEERRLARALLDATAAAQELLRKGTPSAIVAQRLSEALLAAESTSAVQVRPTADMAKDEIIAIDADLESLERGEDIFTAVPTGIPKLDTNGGSPRCGVVTVLAGPPGGGKSTAMLGIGRSEARAGFVFPFFSLEDHPRNTVQRALASISGVDGQVIADRRHRDGSPMTSEEFRRVKHAAEILRTYGNGLVIVPCAGKTAAEISRMARSYCRRFKVRAVGIDYVQRNKPIDPKARDDLQITQSMVCYEKLAQDEHIAVIVGSQFNRGRDDKFPPRLKDLKGSGGIEETGKLILALEDPRHELTSDGRPAHGPNACNVWILKNFMGDAPVKCPIKYERAFCRMS